MREDDQKRKIQRDRDRIVEKIENKRIKKEISDKNLKRNNDLYEQRKSEKENLKKIADLERGVRDELSAKEYEVRNVQDIAMINLTISEQIIISNKCREDRYFLRKLIQNKEMLNEECEQERNDHNELIGKEIIADKKQMAAIMSKRQKNLKDTKFF